MSTATNLNQLKNSYNSDQQKKESSAIASSNGQWDKLNMEAKQELYDEFSKYLVSNYKTKLTDISKDVQREKEKSFNKIQSLKFPNISSPDSNLKLYGQGQLNQAETFLSSPRSTNHILTAIQTAIDSNRMDFAFAVIDSILNEQNSNILTDKQRLLIQGVNALYGSLKLYPEIQQAEKELREVSLLEGVIKDFEKQLDEKSNCITLINLSYFMDESEQEQLLSDLKKKGNLYELIQGKKKIAEFRKGI